MRRRLVSRSVAILAIALVAVAVLMPFLSWIEASFLFHPRAAPTDERIAERTPGLERWCQHWCGPRVAARRWHAGGLAHTHRVLRQPL